MSATIIHSFANKGHERMVDLQQCSEAIVSGGRTELGTAMAMR